MTTTNLTPITAATAAATLPPAPAASHNPPPTTGGIEAFEAWLLDRLCELETQFESYVTESSTRTIGRQR